MEQGFQAIDVDRVGHIVLEEQRERIVRRFGSGVLGDQGKIDRRVLGAIVFKNRRALQDLENIVHPEMVRTVQLRLQGKPGLYVINAAILFRMGLERFCDLVICVRAPLLKQLLRIMSRDRLGPLSALRRILSQRRICPKMNENSVDIYYVSNSKSLGRLEEQALAILREKGIIT